MATADLDGIVLPKVELREVVGVLLRRSHVCSDHRVVGE